MKCKRQRRSPMAAYAAFGGGLLACAVLPTKWLVVLLAAALVLCGLSCGKR